LSREERYLFPYLLRALVYELCDYIILTVSTKILLLLLLLLAIAHISLGVSRHDNVVRVAS